MRTLRCNSFAVWALSTIFAVVLASSLPSAAQTFRGGITGTVTDESGAVVPNAAVHLVATETGTTYNTVSSSAGVFQFQDLPLGTYQLTITVTGFATTEVTNIPVSSGLTYNAAVKLAVQKQTATVEVSANALALETTQTALSSVMPSQSVQDIPRNGRDYTQNIIVLPGSNIAGGSGITSIDGGRVNSVNWQIEGTDDNDLWWNMPAGNESGVSAIAGTLIPMDAIDQFSFVTNNSSDSGRNASGTSNIVIKSGTNQLHGSLYYFNRNEALAAKNPFSSKKLEVRNQNLGGSIGGPIWKNKLFFFVAYEKQQFTIGNITSSTEPSAAYQAQAESILSFYGVPVNPLSTTLLANLWPAAALTGPAQLLNYHNPTAETGHSNNGVIKIDANLTDKDHLSAKWFGGQGPQLEPTSSFLTPYYEVSGTWVQNYSLIYDRTLSARLTNQLAAGVSYIQEAFRDQNSSYNSPALGLETGVTSPQLSGAPKISIGPVGGGSGSFDSIGLEPLSGRNNTTGQLDETASYAVGAHIIRAGGEFRRAMANEFYQTGQRGIFTFDGSQGPWNYPTTHSLNACDGMSTKNLGTAPPSAAANVLALADFLAGCVSTSNIVQGDRTRKIYVTSFAAFGQDAWQLRRGLNVNYGVRYEYTGPMHNGNQNLTVFDPTVPGGIGVAGSTIGNIYHQFWKGASPRVGFAYQPYQSSGTVIRGAIGLYYDTTWLAPFLNLSSKNGGPFGVQDNPAGNSRVAQSTVNGYVWENGVPVFPPLASTLAAQTGVINLFSVAKNFQPAATYTYNLNIEQSVGKAGIAVISYVGTEARHLLDVIDINQAALGSAFVPAAIGANCQAKYASAALGNEQCSRPYYSQFPNFGVINQLQSGANSNYNALQATWTMRGWHSIAGQLNYTWSHALDVETGLTPYLPQNSTNLEANYGNGDYDVRNSFSGYLTYHLHDIDGGSNVRRMVSNGWQFNSLLTFRGGEPFTVVASSNVSGNGESSDRANVVGNPFQGVSHKIVNGAVQWYNPAAFANPAKGSYGDERRGQFYSPGESEVDLSVFKNNSFLDGKFSTQFRVEMFNLFNTINLAPLGTSASVSGTPIRATLGTSYGAPGIGPGEPFNTQLALKIIF